MKLDNFQDFKCVPTNALKEINFKAIQTNSLVLFAVAPCRYLLSMRGYSQSNEIYTSLKMEPRREIKSPSLNEYLCFETDNCRT